MIAASRNVPSVATTMACVSPRVNNADPCAFGSTPTSIAIGRTVLQVAAVDTRLTIQHALANQLFFQLAEHFADFGVGILRRCSGADSSATRCVAQLADARLTLLLVRHAIGRAEVCFHQVGDSVDQRVRSSYDRRHFPPRFAGFRRQLLDRLRSRPAFPGARTAHRPASGLPSILALRIRPSTPHLRCRRQPCRGASPSTLHSPG